MLDDLLVLRLEQVEQSNKHGMYDVGFPDAMRKLSALRYVSKKDDANNGMGGYCLTEEGKLFLKTLRAEMRLRKQQIDETEETDEDY